MPPYGGTGTPVAAPEPEHGYCTREQLEELMSVTFIASSKPTDDKACEIIEEVASEMDGVLAAVGYPLPIIAESALRLLCHYNTYGAAAAAWHSGYVTDRDMPRVIYWSTEYRGFLSRIKNGQQTLPDVIGTMSETVAASGALTRAAETTTEEY